MDDYINRQAAIDLVRDVCDAVMSGCESWYDPETGDEVYKDIREVDAILKCNKEVRIALRNMSSAQPDVPESCVGNMISRQAAIDAVDNYIGTFDAIDVNFLDGLKTAKKLMMQLPSAQPTQLNTHNTLKALDCISRQAAIDAVRSYYDECDERDESIEERIEQLPSANIDLSEFSDKLWAAAYERGKAEVVRWISCSERLPAKKTEVIYTLDNNYVSTGYMTDRDYNGDEMELHWEDMESGALIYPEAWMPLPKPYEGSE